MKNNHILILSAGRRVELVQAFQNEANQFSDGINVYCTDLHPEMSAACQVATQSFSVPPIVDEHYIDAIYQLAKKHHIGLIIPTIDTELPKLAAAKNDFEKENIHIVISDSELITQCRDKRQTASLFQRHQINTPKLYSRNNITFPCFVKPYDGSRAMGAQAIYHHTELTENILNNPKMMFCELIDIQNDYQEYTVDMYYDKQGHLKCVVPRERLEVRTGEVSKGITRRNHLYDYLIQHMSQLDGANGCLTAQFFYQQANNHLYGVEINPRFGGGFPLTYSAGGNYPNWLIREYLYQEPIAFFDQWENNLMMLRYDAKVLVHEQSTHSS